MATSLYGKTITRRRALSGGVACALAALGPRSVFGVLASEMSLAAMPPPPNLYAFAGAHPGTTAIAVTWQPQGQMYHETSSKLCVHAGSNSWEFDLRNRSLLKLQSSAKMSVFIGDVLSLSGVGEEPVRALVIELPNQVVGQRGAPGIWAEYKTAGLRRRIGAPFLANLVAADQGLATIYHSSSPAEDRDMLTNPLAKAITARLLASGVFPNAGFQGRRLASALLPDVLRYDPGRPTGFTFAAQNGRHPAELTDEVVNALFNGGASSASSVRPPYHHVESFPYFRQLTASV